MPLGEVLGEFGDLLKVPAVFAERAVEGRRVGVLPDVHLELELVEQGLVAEAADPGPLGLVRGPQVRLELLKLGKGVAAVGALEELVTLVEVLEGRFLVVEFLAADVAVDGESLGLSVPLAPRVGCETGLGEFAILLSLRVLLEAIWADERSAGTSLRLVELKLKKIEKLFYSRTQIKLLYIFENWFDVNLYLVRWRLLVVLNPA